MNEERIEELEHKIKLLEMEGKQNSELYKQMWILLQTYVFPEVHKVGNIKFTKKQLFVPFVFWIATTALRYFKII